MKPRIILTATLVCLGNILFSQQIFKGKIQNEAKQPLANVNILNLQDSTPISSNEKGIFELENTHKIPIRFTAIGYETWYDTIYPNQREKTFTLNLSLHHIEEVQVVATRAGNNTPTTYSNLNAEAIQQKNFGQDLPYLLDGSLSTVVSSDAGAGVGYTNIRIRGVDQTGTNVTINGIPINDAESQAVFWVNMPDFASSAENIQIQRGVGTSSNGGAAFGASINVKSDKIKQKAYLELDNSYGSFNTVKNTLKAGTGILKKHYALDVRLSNILSKGYIDRSRSNLKSYYVSGVWFNNKSMLKFITFGGKEITYQAWNGVPESRIKNDSAGMHAYAERNGLSSEETDNLFNSGRKYNYFTYKNQVDHYMQTHYQLHFNHSFNNQLKFNVSLHYTKGKGYYEEYKNNQKLSNYNIPPIIINDSISINKTDLIRRKWLDNHFYGVVYNLNYTKGNLELMYGGGFNQYIGKHYGDVIWARFASTSEIYQKYYNDKSSKIDFNNYLKVNYQYKKNIFFADVQLRVVHYVFEGISDINNTANLSTQKVNYVFFNPKIGWMYHWNKQHDTYASFAISNREPIRKDFTENIQGNRPKHETLYDLEIGHKIQKNKWSLHADYFMMYYNNQLILTGQINDVGGYTRTNVKKSYRTGFELEASYQPLKWMTIFAGGTYSFNKIMDFTEFVDDYDNGGQAAIQHKNTDIALSPNLIVFWRTNFNPVKNFNINLNGKYVSRQYLDNAQDKARSIKGYYVMDASLSYLLEFKKIKGIEFSVLINNLLNKKYENNGYTYSYIYDTERIKENFYFPQAGINAMGRIVIKL
jgi:iron complex outermembrane receptor protein